MAITFESAIKWHTATFPDVTMEELEHNFSETLNNFDGFWSSNELEDLVDMMITSIGIMRFDYYKGMNYLTVTFGKIYLGTYHGEAVWRAVEDKINNHKDK